MPSLHRVMRWNCGRTLFSPTLSNALEFGVAVICRGDYQSPAPQRISTICRCGHWSSATPTDVFLSATQSVCEGVAVQIAKADSLVVEICVGDWIAPHSLAKCGWSWTPAPTSLFKIFYPSFFILNSSFFIQS